MKTFSEIRKKTYLNEKSVFSKKVNRVPVEVKEVGGKFYGYVDGDLLDKFRSKKDAETSVVAFAKEMQ